MEFSEQEYLELCKTKIEEKYHAGIGGGKMRQRDFEYLIDLIEDKSGIKLSVSTLKRLWRDGNNHNPHPSTLDALVSLLGYKDWLDFKLKNTLNKNLQSGEPSESKSHSKKMILTAVTAFVVICFAVLAAIRFNYSSGDVLIPEEDIPFTANKTVLAGVPSTVVFNYDVKGIRADSFFIQQDWNPNHRDRIDPEGEYFSSIFYMPGYHKTKLIANETILKIIPVHIQTEGWMSVAVYNYDERPVYLPQDRTPDGILTANQQDILDSKVEIERFYQSVFLNIREFGELDGHNFNFETRVRYREFLNDPCPYLQATIHTEAHIYYIPLTLKGCVSNLAVKIGEVYETGRDNDFSAFGTDVYDWQEVSLSVEDKTGRIYLNGESIYETTFEQDFGKIVGIDYRFSGLGEVDYLRLRNLDDKLVYEEDFEEQER